MKENGKKITVVTLIEGGRTFSEEYNTNQKVQVLVNKTLEHFNLSDSEKRTLTRSDGSVISDLKGTLEELGIRDGETLRFLLKSAPKPEQPKKFA
ncbi:MAG TPA: DUF2604 domain-containing protein [Chryseosolibacter sp.]